MGISGLAYDFQFSPAEIRQIERLRSLDRNRKALAWSAGIAVVLLIFFSQLPWSGRPHIIHAFATFGCLPLGVAAGLGVYFWIDRFVERAFKEKWDPMFYQRSGTTPEHWDWLDAVNRAVERPGFISLPQDEQKRIMSEINRAHGKG